MVYIPVAVEMYSVRNEFHSNPWQTMKELKKMGYEGVEFAGPAQFEPEFYAALLKESGLVCCGWHTPWSCVQPDAFEATVRLNQAVGNKYVIIPGLSATSIEDWKRLGGEMNAVSDKLAAYGMRTGYHCHAEDFQVVDGQRTWDALMGVLNNRCVMQLDTGNAFAGGADIMGELNKYPGLCKTVHLKPYGFEKKYEALIGEDDCPWMDIFDFCQKKGDTEWYIIEYECPAYPALEAVEKCLQAVRKMIG